MCEETKNIVVGDRSASYAYLHSDGLTRYGASPTFANPLLKSARTATDLQAFNEAHPLYGGLPVDVLVPDRSARRPSSSIRCRVCSGDVPPRSFFKLRKGLYMTSPELTFVRMASNLSFVQAVEFGTNLCGRYYLKDKPDGNSVEDRTALITTPNAIRDYLDAVPGMWGCAKARKALTWVLPNSGSPAESKTQVQFRLPLQYGGFALPFDAMNFDVRAGRMASLVAQSDFCLDLVSTDAKFGLEYDGEESHPDASHDKQRRNDLLVLGWRVFPIDKRVLYSAEETERVGHELAKLLRVRIRKPRSWENEYIKLRSELGLPTS